MLPNWGGNTRYIGPTGPAGTNGTSAGLVLYLDAPNSTTVPTTGSIVSVPITTTKTTIDYSANSSTVLLATFPTATGLLSSVFVPGGLWDFNIFLQTTAATNEPSFYFSLYQVDSDGVSNPVLIADGSGVPIVILNIAPEQLQYVFPLYVPATTLTDSTKRLQARLYGVYRGGSRHIIAEFRDSLYDHIHTTLAAQSGPTGPTGPTGLYNTNWSPYPATTNVNLSNFNISNANTITGATTLNLNGLDMNVTADGSSDIANETTLTILARNGQRGNLTIQSDPGYGGGLYGKLSMIANGGTVAGVISGGEIVIQANTPSFITTPALPSAIKMSAFGISANAGLTSPNIALPGYNVVSALNGVQLISGIRGGTLPSLAGANFLYGAALLGGAGTRVENGLAADILTPLAPGNLAIQGNSGSGTVSLSNVSGITLQGSAVISNASGNIVLAPTSGSNTQINSRLDMNGNNIGTVGNIYFSLADTIASTSSNFIVSTHSNQTYNVGGDFTVNTSNMVVNAPLNLTGHDLSNVFNMYSPSNLIAITTGAGNNLSLVSGSNLNLTGTNINLNGTINVGGDLNMSNHNISNVSNISSSSNLTLTGSNIYLNTNVILGGPSSNYFSFASKNVYGLAYLYGDTNIHIAPGAGYTTYLDGFVNIGSGGGKLTMSGNIDMATSNILQLNNISNTTCGFNVNTAAGYNVALNSGAGVSLTASPGYTISLTGPIVTGAYSINSTGGNLFNFSAISNAAGTGTITGYSIAGGGGGTASGFSIISNSPSITIITPDLSIQAPTNFSNNTVSNVSNFAGTGTISGFSTISNSNLTLSSSNTTITCSGLLSNVGTGGVITQTSSSNYVKLDPLYVEIASGSNSIVVPTLASTTLVATGGTITDVGGRRYHTFTSNDTFIVSANPDSIAVEIFAIGGGGGGGSVSAGGGGGGNAILMSYTPSTGSNSIVVGAGATGGTYGSGVPASQGGYSSVSGVLYAVGGGTGGVYGLNAGGSGGCGGGGSELAYLAYGLANSGTVSVGTTISNVAFIGGTGANNGSAGGAGGGGAGAVGQDCPANSPVGGNGGAGILYRGSYYGGGGGGQSGGSYWGTPVAGLGGVGGGGNGGLEATAGADGVANTGGGGGGSGYSGSGIQGGTGGSGIVIISYPLSSGNIIITDSAGIDLDGPVITTSTLTTGSDVTVGGVLYAPQIGSNVNMLSNAISNASSYSANSAYSNQISFPFYSYIYSTNLAIGTNFTPVNVFGSTSNWYFDVSASSPYVPSQTGGYDIGIQVVLPVERSDGSNGPYPNLSADTRYTLTASTYSNYTLPFAYWQGTIGDIRDQCGEQQSGSNSFFSINATQLNCTLYSNAPVYFQICFQNVVGSNFPNNGNFSYYARRMV